MNYWALISCALLGLGIVVAVTPLILRVSQATNLGRNRRDLHHTHQQPISRLGGLALALAFVGVDILIGVLWPQHRTGTTSQTVVLLSSLAMFGLGFWDDLKPLGAKRKLLGQVVIALAVCGFGIQVQGFKIPFTETILHLGGWGVVLTVLWLVGMTNLINLIDGVDGLASGICLMLMCLLAYVGHDSGGMEFLVAGVAGALLGFLWFNFPPARIYLGDGGAYFLGFQIGLYAILNSHKGTVLAALVAPLFVLALPILDTSLAILRRGLRGLPIFRPDRKHLHHHLLQMGLSHRKVVLWFYGLTLVFLAMGFAAYRSRGNLTPVLLGIATLILLFCAGRLRFSRDWFAIVRVVCHSLQMRQETEYALALTRWLALEGNRRHSAEELWSDLLFAAQRLGYCSVKLTLADGERVWGKAIDGPQAHSVVQPLSGGRLGTLELKASLCEDGGELAQRNALCDKLCCPCVADERVFEIVSELLAEGWSKAAARLAHGSQAPLRFDTRRLEPKPPCPRRIPVPLAPVGLAPAKRQPADSLAGTVQ